MTNPTEAPAPLAMAVVGVEHRDAKITELMERLAALEDLVTSLARSIEDLGAATEGGISDNTERLIALESRIADR